MPNKRLSLILGFAALFCGFFLYVLFREETYIAKLFRWIPALRELRDASRTGANAFAKYYLPEFLWGFSLCCFLRAVYPKGKWMGMICAAVAFAAGLLWETLQLWGAVGGTFDILDITAYFTASLLAIIILKERKA